MTSSEKTSLQTAVLTPSETDKEMNIIKSMMHRAKMECFMVITISFFIVINYCYALPLVTAALKKLKNNDMSRILQRRHEHKSKNHTVRIWFSNAKSPINRRDVITVLRIVRKWKKNIFRFEKSLFFFKVIKIKEDYMQKSF